ncbi:MAG: DUF2207 domain-containing protein [Candidatus Hydrogenedentota bacterium]|nr:MAG: DUF2207 domain-containing protein [Candidatus Hydrogenedentota bacterium]
MYLFWNILKKGQWQKLPEFFKDLAIDLLLMNFMVIATFFATGMKIYWMEVIMGVAYINFIIWLVRLSARRTAEGTKIKKQVKQLLKNAFSLKNEEKNRETLEKIFPYAVAAGKHNKFVKKFPLLLDRELPYIKLKTDFEKEPDPYLKRLNFIMDIDIYISQTEFLLIANKGENNEQKN